MKYLSLFFAYYFISISTFAQEQDPCFSINDYNLLLQEENSSIQINLYTGWNLIGYPCKESIDLIDAFESIVDKIIIVKDNFGSVYMPEFNFNGIGMLNGGTGYQIKMNVDEYGFTFCDNISFPTIEGCMNCEAINYNHWANHDDGSCTFSITQQNIHQAAALWRNNPELAEIRYGQISDWDLSDITNISALFTDWSMFNHDISNWDVSNITNMGSMFFDTDTVIVDISNWDVSSVNNMSCMFRNVYFFEGDISTWDVSEVTDMSLMFESNHTFNGDLSNWNVGNVTDMSYMFEDAFSFSSDLSNWNVGNVTNMYYMFRSASSFNSDISNWDVSNVTNMNSMFSNANSFNSNVSNWDVSNVTNMNSMFSNANSFNSNVSNWDVSNVTNMSYMFLGATSFNNDISNWDVSNVTNMSCMFYGATSYNNDISNWDVSNVTNMSSMFYGATSFNNDISNWDVSNVTNMYNMFSGAQSLSIENKCAIQTTFSINENWPYYNWDCPIAVGDYAEGGIVFYVDSTGEHGLVVSLYDLENGEPYYYEEGIDNFYFWSCNSCNYQDFYGAQNHSIGSGYQNTIDIIQEYNYNSNAAFACLEYSASNYNDWYLPSKNELSLIFNNLDSILSDFNYWSSTCSDNYSNNSKAYSMVGSDGTFSLQSTQQANARVRAIRSF